jgi:hypothetical protein
MNEKRKRERQGKCPQKGRRSIGDGMLLIWRRRSWGENLGKGPDFIPGECE